MRWLLSLTTLLPFASAFAGVHVSLYQGTPLATNLTCASAYISDLTIVDVTQFQNVSGQNICALPEESIPAPLHLVIKQITELNLGVAKALGRPAANLFQSGLKINIGGDEGGPMASSEDKNTVLPDWDGTSIQSPIYVHELGHTLGDSVLTDFDGIHDTDTFSEPFADLLAASVLNTRLLENDPTLPNCMRYARVLSPDKSFNAPLKNFNGFQALTDLSVCCTQVNLMTANELTINSCKIIAKYAGQSLPSMNTSENMAKFNAPLNPKTVEDDDVDAHMYSEPINSFLLELADHTGTPALTAMQAAAATYHSLSHIRKWKCSVPDKKVATVIIPDEYQSYIALLRLMRAPLSPALQVTFDKLWAQHGMSVAEKIDFFAASAVVSANASPSFQKFLTEHQCDDANPSAACTITCL